MNGNGHGSKLGELANINVNSPEFNPNDFFLDHVAGDLYSYNPENDEWVPVTNIGLHYERAVHEANTIGKYVVKSPVYHPKTSNNAAQYNFDETSQKLCILKKHNYSHWLFEKVSSEFIVPWKRRWDVHSFSFLDPTKVFTILAESKTGPVIIEFHNIVAVQFEITRKYPDTVQIFRNFIGSILKKLISNEPCQVISVSRYKELENKEYGFQGYVFKKNGSLKELKLENPQFENTRGFKPYEWGSPTKTDSKQPRFRPATVTNNYLGRTASVGITPQKEFIHSGFASKQKGPQIVTQNVIASTRIQVPRKAHHEGFYSARLGDLKEEFKQNYMNHRESVNNSIEGNLQGAATHRGRVESRKNSMPKLGKSSVEALKPEMRVSSVRVSPNTSQMYSEVPSDPALFKGNIRKFLYPELDEELIGQQRAWVIIMAFSKF